MANSNGNYAKLSPRDKLATCRLKARTQYPYFSSALLNLIPREQPGLGTLGVTANMVLLWDPAAVATWPMEELVGTLVHEVGHVLRAHHARAKAMGILGADGRPVDPRLARLWNFAGDCEINDDLVETHPELFKEPRVSLLPKQFKLQDGLTAEAYYSDLRQQAEQMSQALKKALEEAGAEGDGDGEGKGKQPGGAPTRGRCGSCAGNPVDGEPNQAGGKPGDSEASNDGRSEVEIDRIRKEVAEAVRQQAAKGRGSVPSGWARWAEATLTPPKVRWQDKLARLCRNAVAWKAGAVDLNHKAMSRRQWGIGVGRGRPMLPSLRAPIPQVAVTVDTSGSMGDGELSAALRETRGIMQSIGARVTFLSCDAAVHGIKVVTNWQELPGLLKGGGGTDFRPVFDKLASATRNFKSDVLVFCTDGCGPAPEQPPPNLRVIWLLIGPHKQRPCTWGEFVEIDD